MDILIQISGGFAAPAECCFAVVKVTQKIKKEALPLGIIVSDIHEEPGEHPRTAKSITLFASGKIDNDFIDSWQGTVQWIGQSPFRPNHKRKNWFVGVEFHNVVEKIPPVHKKEVKVDVFRASGPGGQHRNKVESAVRVTHISSGIVASASEERSQTMNLKLAMIRLAHKMQEQNQKQLDEKKNQMWQQHQNLERGNAIRVYRGKNFTLKRT